MEREIIMSLSKTPTFIKPAPTALVSSTLQVLTWHFHWDISKTQGTECSFACNTLHARNPGAILLLPLPPQSLYKQSTFIARTKRGL